MTDEFKHDTMPEAYKAIIQHLLHNGQFVSPRGMQTKELIGHSFTLYQPIYNVVTQASRKLNPSFLAGELLWMLTGTNDARLITPYNKQIGQYSEEGFFKGAYGPKLMEQLPYVIQTLSEDPESRQALLTLWRERPGKSRDIPCTISMQFFIRNDLLDMVVYMRSNDAWLGLPYDVFNFTMIQQYVASFFGISPGWYHHHVGSLHLYEQHWRSAQALMTEDITKIPLVQSNSLTGPIPGTVLTVFTGLTLLGESRGVSKQNVADWLDLSNVERYAEWIDLLKLCAFRFHKNTALLPAQWQVLLKYWDQYSSEQAAERGG